MKKLSIIIFMVLMCLNIDAQAFVTDSDGRYPVYCTIMCSNFWGIGKVNATMDFGGGRTWMGSICYIVDDDGHRMKFTSNMGAVNYMAKRGWKLDKTVFLTEGKSNVLYYIMVKYVKDDSEITAGINYKSKDPVREKTGDDMFDAGIDD